jgi:hypothetical protein
MSSALIPSGGNGGLLLSDKFKISRTQSQILDCHYPCILRTKAPFLVCQLRLFCRRGALCLECHHRIIWITAPPLIKCHLAFLEDREAVSKVTTLNIHVERVTDYWLPSMSLLGERDFVSLEPLTTFLDVREVVC